MFSRNSFYRHAMIVASQATVIIISYYLSFLLRFDYMLTARVRPLIFSTLAIVLAIKLICFWRFGLLKGWWRYVGISDLLDIAKAALTSSVLSYLVLMYVVRPQWYPRSVLAIDLLLTVLLVGGARFAVRAYTEMVKTSAAERVTLIAGAGQAGSDIARQLKQNPDLGYKPIGFVDDNQTKMGIKIHGLKVLGTTALMPELIRKYEVECVLIAIPSARGRTVEAIVSKCREAKVEFKVIQSIGRRIHGPASRPMRDLRVEDLLGRDPVSLDFRSIQRKIQDQVLMITGAGGSIGSELCRQIAGFHPRKLVLFERSENDIFKVCNELSGRWPHVECVPVVGDILDVRTLQDCCALHRPTSVLHAAAYKHVPMMEVNCFQAVANNVFGTYNMALVARQFQVHDFVLISSDKAVNPTNVMGVTKRICELIILALQQQKTRYIAVRFGNVLGSNGSVVPIFQQQIAAGGPVLVTHPDAKRYFMTIPEAAQLVLQASTMGLGREIFILKMGEPVRIVDLANNLIRLSGYEPGTDIKVVFTGLRPGEKLFEELLLEQEGIMPTSHEKLYVLDGGDVDFTTVRLWLDDLSSILKTKNVNALVNKLQEIVPEYSPSPELQAMCEVDRHDFVSRYANRLELDAA